MSSRIKEDQDGHTQSVPSTIRRPSTMDFKRNKRARQMPPKFPAGYDRYKRVGFKNAMVHRTKKRPELVEILSEWNPQQDNPVSCRSEDSLYASVISIPSNDPGRLTRKVELKQHATDRTDVLPQTIRQAEERFDEPTSTKINNRKESAAHDEATNLNHDSFPDDPTTESDFEDNESSEADTTASESSSNASLLSPVLDKALKATVEDLMIEIKALLNYSSDLRSRTTSTGSSKRTNTTSPPAIPTEQSSQHSANTHGDPNSGENDSSGSSGDNGGDGRNTEAQTESLRQNTPPRKFACPYYRRNPLKHKNHRSCAGPGWISVHRVKQHVYRQHSLIYCRRCCTKFKTDLELESHQLLPQACDVRIGTIPEGYTKVQEKLLRKRQRGLGSEEDKWRNMFRCLFPDDSDDMIPTPYYDNEGQSITWESRRDDEFAQFERYLLQETPQIVRRQLEQLISEPISSLEGELRTRLSDLVRDAQSEVVRAYREANATQSPFQFVPGAQESRTYQPGLEHFNVQEHLPVFDISAFSAPPPNPGSHSTPVIPIGVAGSSQAPPDSGYGTIDPTVLYRTSEGRAIGSSGAILDVFNEFTTPLSTSYMRLDDFDAFVNDDLDWLYDGVSGNGNIELG